MLDAGDYYFLKQPAPSIFEETWHAGDQVKEAMVVANQIHDLDLSSFDNDESENILVANDLLLLACPSQKNQSRLLELKGRIQIHTSSIRIIDEDLSSTQETIEACTERLNQYTSAHHSMLERQQKIAANY
ncbi:hypothetical protein M5689_018979 [Euphorbia peplus]|nr:hypothetical protein M5689_018979 [Euphorbia peplus]